MATNFIRASDPAFLRHGRFDYVIPVGPPDATARRAIWQRYLPEAVRDEVDLATLVADPELFTPADIEFAARTASQQALEAAVYGGDRDKRGPTTEDYQAAIAKTRPTLTSTMVEEFEEDIQTPRAAVTRFRERVRTGIRTCGHYLEGRGGTHCPT